MKSNDHVFVSVIIPVFNDSERLKLCLEALEKQTYPQNLYEVIVVDNGSKEDIESVVTAFQQTVFSQELRPGSYAARNQGISLAKGEILAFTDSDCIPATDWIEKGVFNLQATPNCGIIGGRIHTFFQDSDHPTPVELYDSVMAFPQKNYVEKDKFAVGANLFTWKAILEKIGGFNEQMKSGGDYELGQRIAAAGYQIVYAADTCVNHPARYSFQEISKKITRVIEGQYEFKDNEKITYNSQRFVKDLLKDLVPPVKFSVNIFQNENLSFSQKLQVIYVRFYVKYLRAWARGRHLLKLKT